MSRIGDMVIVRTVTSSNLTWNLQPDFTLRVFKCKNDSNPQTHKEVV